MPVCANCGQENPDIARFCLACAAPLTEPAPAAVPRRPAQERKLVTGLFVDVVGSTARAEGLDPEDVEAMLGTYHTRVRAELERFGGTVEKFIGDAVFALFGAPVGHEDDPERAVTAAFAILAAVSDLNQEDEWLDLHVRVGVHTGEALVMLDAKPGEGEWMAAGDIVNTAARIQSAAPVDGVLVGELTYGLTRETIAYEPAEAIAAKGKSEPVQVWVASGVREHKPEGAMPDVPLVGRDTELDALEAVWQRVRTSERAALAAVLGSPGIGKSRLLAEFAARAGESGTVLTGRCLPYGEGITYWPVIEILKQAAGILQSDSAETESAKLGAVLERLPTRALDELRTMGTALANLIGAPSTPRGTYAAEEIGQAELHWGVRRILELLASEHPLVCVFEDLHWAEPTLVELLTFLVQDGPRAPLLVVGSGRPELADTNAPLVAAVGQAVVRLEALSSDDSETLLGKLVGTEELARDPAATLLLRNAGGNPLFLEETVRMLRDAGLVDRSGWRLEPGDGDLPIPTSLQALIGARLDQLAPREKQIAQQASVVGSVFWPGAVAHLEEQPSADKGLAQGISALERRELVYAHAESTVAGEREFAFKHITIRDVAYGQLPKGRRVGMHVRFSEWVGALPGVEDEFVEIVAWHLEQACRLAGEVARTPVPPPALEAAGALAHAAEKALRREGMREARRYYERALAVLGESHSETATELRLRRAATLAVLGEPKLACEQLVDVVEQAVALGRRDLHCAALVELGDVDHWQGRAAEGRERLTTAEALAKEIGDELLQVRAAFVLALLRYNFEGGFDDALAGLRKAVPIAERIGDRALLAEGRLRLSALLINAGRYDEASEELGRCLEVASRMGSQKIEAEATAWLSGVKYYIGDFEEGKRLGLQAREWLERTGDGYFLVQNLISLATYGLLEGDVAFAEEQLRDALPVALEIGGWMVVETYRYLIQTLLRQDRLDDARALLSFAARSVPEEDLYARAALLLAEANVATAAGERTAAATAFAEALRLLEELQLPVELAEARMALARSLRSFGDLTSARTEFERARNAFARMGSRTMLTQIEREQVSEGAGPAGSLVTTSGPAVVDDDVAATD